MVNRLKKLSPQFRKILKVSSEIADALGYRIYLVGGVVRDLVLDRDVFDLDIVVEGDAIVFTRHLAQKLSSPFSRHHAFGTATVTVGSHKIDFATARTEHYPHPGALPKVEPATLIDDLFRRDFTINAMAISVNKGDYGRVVDAYRGLSDLKNKTIRVLHERSFFDDPTRILRAVRFEQRFAFHLEPLTASLLKEALAADVLTSVSSHRLRDELILILQEPKPCAYIRRIKEITGFGFMSQSVRLTKKHFDFFKRIDGALRYYHTHCSNDCALRPWLVYLGGMLLSVSRQERVRFFHDFAFKKQERVIVHSMHDALKSIRKLNRTVKPHVVYRHLCMLSVEALLFFYAYYSHRKIRNNIAYFLTQQRHVALRIRGRDLKRRNLKPEGFYGRVFKELLNRKLDHGFSSKEDELKTAIAIFHDVSATGALAGRRRQRPPCRKK